jgi:asparagine synthase (glutamine-hydrolysing)
MSAISLIWKSAGVSPVSLLHRAMQASLHCHGTASKSAWADSNIALGVNQRLSLPEDQFDVQPLWSPDHSCCLVADVRLDNRAALARELGLVHPETLPDSAFLMAAWLGWGSTCVDHLLGGYAFAIYTPARQEIFAARDHAGERPLFYHRDARLFAIASMPKGLLALPGVPREFNQAHIVNWLAALKPQRSDTFFSAIECLPPGHYLRFTPHTFVCKQYWHPANAAPVRYQRDEDYAEAVVELLDQATSARLRSTRPVGSFLSAGLDSSSVTASAATLLKQQGRSIAAFTSVPRPEFDGIVNPWHLASEAEGAADVARLYPNVEHHLVDSCGYDLLPILHAWNDALDEPFPNVINSLWIKAILDRAGDRGIGVMLEGAIGNLTFSWNSWAILGQFFRQGRWLQLAATTRSLHHNGALSLRAAARAATRNLIPPWLTRRLVPSSHLDGLFDCLINPEWELQHNLRQRMFDTIYFPPSDLVEEQCSYLEFGDSGPFNMAAETLTQVELRDPTADKRLIEFCLAIPRQQYIAGGQARSLARRAMKDRLPAATINRQVRGVQGPDWYVTETEALPSMRDELCRLRESPAAAQFLDLQAMQNLLDTWPQADFNVDSVLMRWENWLTRAFSMGHFLRTHDPALLPQPEIS